jgi:hypothetical protein
MNRLLNILKIVLFFTMSIFFICFIVSIVLIISGQAEIKDFSDNLIEHFLYVVGYGDSKTTDIIRLFFALIGLITVSAMSAVLTIKLFWKIDDVKINEKCFITKRNNKAVLSFFIMNRGANICNVNLKLSSYYDLDTASSEMCFEKQRPLLLEKTIWEIHIPIKDEVFQGLRHMYQQWMDNTKSDISLFLTVSYVDTTNGQETIQVKQFTYNSISMPENIIFDGNSFNKSCKQLLKKSQERYINDDIVDWLTNKTIIYDIKQLQRVENSGSLTKVFTEETAIDKYHIIFNDTIKTINTEEFMMLFWNFNTTPENWVTFYNESGKISFNLAATASVENIKFQIKAIINGNRLTIFERNINPDEILKKYEYTLEDVFSSITLEYNVIPKICEICYCVYGKDMNLLEGDIFVSKVKIESCC